ncbi:phosphoglycerate dehydrogenase [Legionella longbeachae]|uniref:Putative D-isomer specific 2-hydroxyacid dehydrogenase n=1 Tax=Legionella longbeachae serogroup 1 (strain NSW150) TaxID=661367 RepID=D3HMC7_LEGLN|nr:phosphoglycerate dehydrogenase [Legionella longbeachae]VEE04038.1 D-isomer specific 2-hydroxyacid dehydrogenase [Legionella oakridgensis]HBD7396899.1 phosphoglycerate dehydrogenase [Legionella pneumophila]ARB93111.1 phosphoglycerate dehydrogenase [Legionella longbeachae]ARM33828.1 phosphoglycerate dehydrogenase [Legionella longbeachae]EEZ96996.1 D-isomer specific 2-hydroxyacid dehydrogenase catalytic domain protein [Legionella longbeachae D-4968]
MKVLVTCPPMLGLIDHFYQHALNSGIELVPAKTVQVLSVRELLELVPQYDGWIIGDDPATREVFTAGTKGRLKAAVKWGIGVDNVDFKACHDLNIPITNTPNMFGGEVADVAIAYLLGLARHLFYIDREVRNNNWAKPAGMSMAGKHIGVIGFGDIGENIVKRLAGFDVKVTVYDPFIEGDKGYNFVHRKNFPEGLSELDFLILACALTKQNIHLLNAKTISLLKEGAKIINVSRGLLIHEQALIDALNSGHISSAALEVFEEEPLPQNSPLRALPQCILGSHNASNTVEGVKRASMEAIKKIAEFLNAKQ